MPQPSQLISSLPSSSSPHSRLDSWLYFFPGAAVPDTRCPSFSRSTSRWGIPSATHLFRAYIIRRYSVSTFVRFKIINCLGERNKYFSICFCLMRIASGLCHGNVNVTFTPTYWNWPMELIDGQQLWFPWLHYFFYHTINAVRCFLYISFSFYVYVEPFTEEWKKTDIVTCIANDFNVFLRFRNYKYICVNVCIEIRTVRKRDYDLNEKRFNMISDLGIYRNILNWWGQWWIVI